MSDIQLLPTAYFQWERRQTSLPGGGSETRNVMQQWWTDQPRVEAFMPPHLCALGEWRDIPVVPQGGDPRVPALLKRMP